MSTKGTCYCPLWSAYFPGGNAVNVAVNCKKNGAARVNYVENDDNYFLPFMHTLRKAQKENVIDQNQLESIFHQNNIKQEALK